MFEIYETDVEIEGQKYKLKPLTGRYLAKFMNVVRKFQKLENTDKDNSSLFDVMDEDTINDLHTISLETFKKSYPNEDVDKLDSFVSQNLFKLIEPVMKTNIRA